MTTATASRDMAMDALCAAAEAGSTTSVIGIDAEWQPPAFERPGAATPPLALLQLATRDRVYAIDLIAAAGDDAMTRALGEHSAACSAVRPSSSLASALPTTFHDWRGRRASRRRRRRRPCSICSRAPASPRPLEARRRLAGTHRAARCGLDKAQQQSDWGARPLTDAQLRYAALDAFCLPLLYDALEALPPAVVDDDDDAPPPPPKPRRVRAPPPSPPPFDAAPTVVSTAVVLRAELPRRAASAGRAHDAHRLCATDLPRVGRGGGGGSGWCQRERAARRSGRAAAPLYINSANARPSGGRYRNLFWRDRATDDVLMCWYRAGAAAQEPRGASARRARRRRRPLLPPPPGRLYRFCGRLRPAALAVPDAADAADAEEDVQQWGPVTGCRCGPPTRRSTLCGGSSTPTRSPRCRRRRRDLRGAWWRLAGAAGAVPVLVRESFLVFELASSRPHSAQIVINLATEGRVRSPATAHAFGIDESVDRAPHFISPRKKWKRRVCRRRRQR